MGSAESVASLSASVRGSEGNIQRHLELKHLGEWTRLYEKWLEESPFAVVAEARRKRFRESISEDRQERSQNPLLQADFVSAMKRPYFSFNFPKQTDKALLMVSEWHQLNDDKNPFLRSKAKLKLVDEFCQHLKSLKLNRFLAVESGVSCQEKNTGHEGGGRRGHLGCGFWGARGERTSAISIPNFQHLRCDFWPRGFRPDD